MQMTIAEIDAFIDDHFPQARRFGAVIEKLEEGRLWMRLAATKKHLRPGGTVSGPTLMTLADAAFYYLILAHIGPVKLAVTTHLSIDFLRRPEAGDLVAEAEMLKLGRRLAVGRVTFTQPASPPAIAHATLTYSIPPRD